MARGPRRRNRHGLSGTDDLAESGDANWRANRRSHPRASTAVGKRRSEPQDARCLAARRCPRTAKPRHPYTQGLLKASPTLKRGALTPIPGTVPQLTALPPGCAFEPRCELRRDECAAAIPALRIIASDHAARCILV